MRSLAFLASLFVMAPPLLAQDEKKEEPKTPVAQEPAAPFGLKPADLDELAKYADRLLGAEIDDGLVGILLVEEARAKRPTPERRPAADAPGGEGERPRTAFRRMEPLGPFVTKKLDEGLKGEALAAAIQTEREKRVAEMTARFEGAGGEGEGRRGGGFGAGGFQERMQQQQTRAGEVIAKLRKEDKKGRALVEGLLKEFDHQGRGAGRRGDRPPGN